MPLRILGCLMLEEDRRIEERQQSLNRRLTGKKLTAILAVPPWVE